MLNLLREEAITKRAPDKNGIVVSLTSDLLELLGTIGDPRAVSLVAELLDGMGGRASFQALIGDLLTAHLAGAVGAGVEPGQRVIHIGQLPLHGDADGVEDQSR